MTFYNRFCSVIQWWILIISIVCCLARLNLSAIGCLKGPNFWCLNDTTESLCNISNVSLGLCGYTSGRCQFKTGDAFCKATPPKQQQPALEFNGGLTGVQDNFFSYYILSLYWPPSSCPSIYNETIDYLRYFCSPFTNRDQPGSERLVLHGLWPTFSTQGNYQGWPQFCSSTRFNWSRCHINGNLCPWTNTTKTGFTQDNYEYCLATENIDECLVNGTEILEPERERLKIFAPGYLNKRNLFINHEWTKHGSCCSSSFGHNISTYLAQMLDLVDLVTRPGSLTYEYIQRYAGEKIGLTYLIDALNQTAIINCNSNCDLEEIWMCMRRDRITGLPGKLVACPPGARTTSDSCQKAKCEYVFLPLHHRQDKKSNLISGYYCWFRNSWLLFLVMMMVIFLFAIFKVLLSWCCWVFL